jgi:hypothetical protein
VRLAFALLGLLLSSCGPTRDQLEDRRVLVDVGMTARQVVDKIGRPTRVTPIAAAAGIQEQTVEVWAYSIKPPPDLGDAAEFVLLSGTLVALSAATGTGDPIKPILNGPRGKGRCTFWVGFGADGRVRGVTNLEQAR